MTVKEDKEALEIEKNNLKGMIRLLIENGIEIEAVDEQKRTAFEVALDSNAVNIIPLLIDNIKLSKTPMLIHRFKKRIFDERYRTILKTLIESDEDVTEETMNVLDD